MKFRFLGTFLIPMDLAFRNLLLCAGICVEICPVHFIYTCAQLLKCCCSSSVSIALSGELQGSLCGLPVPGDLCCRRNFSLCGVFVRVGEYSALPRGSGAAEALRGVSPGCSEGHTRAHVFQRHVSCIARLSPS